MAICLCLLLCACSKSDELVVITSPSPSPTASPQPSVKPFSEEKLEGQWYGYWEMFGADGNWGEMEKQQWKCWASISKDDVLRLWDVDIDKENGLAQFKISRGDSFGSAAEGWFMDKESGMEHCRIAVSHDEYGPLLTVRGSYDSEKNGDFSFVFRLRPEGDKWPKDEKF